jgi:hypothetical protein
MFGQEGERAYLRKKNTQKVESGEPEKKKRSFKSQEGKASSKAKK